jgi:NADH dehydrogenase
MPEVFALGDIARLSDAKGVAVPGLAQGAIQLGQHVGRVILADVAGTRGSVPGFVYVDKGTMATIGRSSAVADLRGWRTGGFVAWVLWLAVHLLFLIDLRSKVTVLIKWTAAYVFYRPTSRVINAAE